MSLLQSSNVVKIGTFHVPGVEPASSLDAITSPIAFNPANNSLFLAMGPPGPAAPLCLEFSIPTDLSGGATGTLLQGPLDPTEGHLQDVDPQQVMNGVELKGLLVVGGQLYGAAYGFYDGDGVQVVSHFKRSVNLSTPSFSGWYQGNGAPAGFIAGALADIPSAWQTALGGKALTGLYDVSIISRTSWGPSAFAFDPATLTNPANPFPVQALCYYNVDHPSLGSGDVNPINPYFTLADYHGGIVFPTGYDSVLHILRHGTGVNDLSPGYQYGVGTPDTSLVGQCAQYDNNGNCEYIYIYDTVVGDQGGHAWPYEWRVVAYDAHDYAAVVAGSKQPWDVVPYAQWKLMDSDPYWTPQVGGVAYDASTQRIYVATVQNDADNGSTKPLISVFHVQG